MATWHLAVAKRRKAWFSTARHVRAGLAWRTHVGASSIMPTVATPVHEATSPRKEVNACEVKQYACRFVFQEYSSRFVQRPCAIAITARQRIEGELQHHLHAFPAAASGAVTEMANTSGEWWARGLQMRWCPSARPARYDPFARHRAEGAKGGREERQRRAGGPRRMRST